MATKLEQKEYPAGHNANNFEAFGPAATKDGKFAGTMICDMGCFTQDSKDTNKYYSAAVVQSKIDKSWWVYFEWGKQGAANPAFQFVKCSSKSEAQSEYEDQLMSKNWKRGQVIDHPVLGQILQAKLGKDCYLVRPQATRSTGLPCMKTIVQNEGAKVQIQTTTVTISSSTPSADLPTMTLMRDLNVGTISFTRAAMQGGALPTQVAIDEGRTICIEAQKRILKVGNLIDDQVNDKEINDFTRIMYSRIPKVKVRNAAPKEWLLTQDNIAGWLSDLDAYESALYASNISQPQSDPFGGMKIKMRHLTMRDPVGEFVYTWFPKASRLKHGYSGIKIINAWEIERDGDAERLDEAQKKIAAKPFKIEGRPLHQPNRNDLSDSVKKIYVDSNTMIGLHASRSSNISGLLRTSWRLPKELVGVKITAWLYGPGVYIADDWGKSIGYSSHSTARYTHGDGAISNRGAFMFITDTVLGSPYLAPSGHPYIKPPDGYHSVFGKMGYSKLNNNGDVLQNNEFIVYDTNQVRARYLIEFDVQR